MPRILPPIDKPLYVGVDPGQSGGLVAVGDGVWIVDEMPPSPELIRNWFQQWRNYKTKISLIERVGGYQGHEYGRQGMGAPMFTFGRNFGWLEMALIGAGFELKHVEPTDWQRKGFGLVKLKTESKVQWKNRILMYAASYFLQESVEPEEITLGTSDALLICAYCRAKYSTKSRALTR